MFIRCSDGFFYKNPVWSYDKRVVRSTELCYAITRTDLPVWSTVRRDIDLKIKRSPGDLAWRDEIIKGQLCRCVVYTIVFLKRPKPPVDHEGIVPSMDGVDDEFIDLE